MISQHWPYDHVERGEVEQELTWQEAKNLRQELERLRETVDEWSCDRCGENKSTCSKGGVLLCNDCAFGDGND